MSFAVGLVVGIVAALALGYAAFAVYLTKALSR